MSKKKIDWVSIIIVLFFLWLIGREFTCSFSIKQDDGTYKNVFGTVPDTIITKQ